MEGKLVEDKLPNLELGSPTPTLPKDFAQDFPAYHSTRVRFFSAHLLDYHCYTSLAILHESHTYHKTSSNPRGGKIGHDPRTRHEISRLWVES